MKKIRKGIRFAFPRYASAARMGMSWKVADTTPAIKGEVSWVLTEEDGTETQGEKKNLVMYDAGIFIARLVTNASTSRNPLMLALGTGAQGLPNSPDAPDPRQRKLFNEVFRKEFDTITNVTSTGGVATVPTHVVDLTVTFESGEAESPLNEMGIICPFDSDPGEVTPNPNTFPTYDADSVNVFLYDILLNYLSFPVLNKPVNSRLTITWRLTF